MMSHGEEDAKEADHVDNLVSLLAPPRVFAAVFRTYFNGWCTARRFQQAGTCAFGCIDYEDSVEHYARCPVLARFGQKCLRLSYFPEPDQRRLDFFLLRLAGGYSDTRFLCAALRLALAYRIHCRSHRQVAPMGGELAWLRALELTVKELVDCHPAAIQRLGSLWQTPSLSSSPWC